MEKNIIWHNEHINRIVTLLNTDINLGLSNSEVRKRLAIYGSNRIAKEKKISIFFLFIQQFRSLVIWVLISATIVSILLGEKIDGIVIFAIVILNAIIGFSLEYRANRAISALQKLAAPKSKVIREGVTQLISARKIVPGDIVLLESGDLVPADSYLIQASTLKINEAPLTGESQPVEKFVGYLPSETPLADRKNMVFMGTSIVNGAGRAIVVETGMNSQIGHIAHLLETTENTESPLQKRLNRVAVRLLWACFAVVIIIFSLGLFRAIPPFELFMSAVSLAVAAIPEGLPAVVTIALALGVQRMVKRNALVKQLSAVETMGCVQVICTDKTGTLTVGEMTARKLITQEHIYNISGEGYNNVGSFFEAGKKCAVSHDRTLLEALYAIASCNNAEFKQVNGQFVAVGDPTEIALLVAAAKADIWRSNIENEMPRLMEIPFNSDRKRMAVLRKQNHHPIAYIKGAPEILIPLCTHIHIHTGTQILTLAERSRMLQSCAWMASEGLRVLAIAEKKIDFDIHPINTETNTEWIEQNIVLLGLIGLQDPPRAEVKEAVNHCKIAGIKPVMITGDHPGTARAIAQELGIYEKEDALITGTELSALSDDALEKKVNKISVYARVTAEHKLKILRAWKKQNRVVAMTGDGVNDAPALKEASVGVAMGITGTEVTKEAADIIILDDNFASIVAAIEEGRCIYDNIAKTLAYLLAGNTSELIVMFIALFIGWPLPLLPIQLLWINLITDGLPALALATDVPEKGILLQPPRSENIQFMDRFFFQKIAFIGLLTAIVTLGAFAYEFHAQNNLLQARDAAFSVLVTAELLRAFGARSHTETIFKIGLFSNLRLFAIIALSFSLQIFIHYNALLRSFFKVGTITWKACIIWILLGAIPLAIIEIAKIVKRRITF